MLRAAFAFAALAALTAASVHAQQPQAGYFKGKLKPGQYDITTDIEEPRYGDMRKTRRRCITADDIGRDAEEAGCEVRNFRGAGTSATWTVVCVGADPRSADTKVAVTPDGFTSEVVVTATEDGKPHVMTQRTRGRYVGICPPTK